MTLKDSEDTEKEYIMSLLLLDEPKAKSYNATDRVFNLTLKNALFPVYGDEFYLIEKEKAYDSSIARETIPESGGFYWNYTLPVETNLTQEEKELEV